MVLNLSLTSREMSIRASRMRVVIVLPFSELEDHIWNRRPRVRRAPGSPESLLGAPEIVDRMQNSGIRREVEGSLSMNEQVSNVSNWRKDGTKLSSNSLSGERRNDVFCVAPKGNPEVELLRRQIFSSRLERIVWSGCLNMRLAALNSSELPITGNVQVDVEWPFVSKIGFKRQCGAGEWTEWL